MASAPFTALGLDVGGTKIAAGIVQFPGGQRSERRSTIPTEPKRGGAAVLEDVLQLAAKLAAESAAAGYPIQALGLGLCELVGLDGEILSAETVRWQDQPVRERLSTVAPATIEADVRAAAAAEALFGAGRGLANFLYLTIGTGISSCLMLGGQPYLGARGLTGTMASSPLTARCKECGAIRSETLEQISSGAALSEKMRAKTGRPEATARDLLDLAARGGPNSEWARTIVGAAGAAAGAETALLVNVLDPEAVIIGGGLGCADGLYWDSLVSSAQRHIWSPVNRALPILQAGTGINAGWIGAAAAAWRAATFSAPKPQTA